MERNRGGKINNTKMKKNILVISSSPRKGGNSDMLCDQFIAGATDSGHKAEKIVLTEMKINYCTGCGICLEKKACPQKDDMSEILDKMTAADVIVMATPVYFYSMSAQMKTLIDRTCAGYTRITNKEFYFIVSAADPDHPAMERTLEGFRGFTDCLENPVEKGVIYGTSVWNKGEVKNKPVMKQAYESGLKV
jgi:multimeric flavodoxin WrbA